MMVHILYPSNKLVTPKQIESWYQDAAANSECKSGYTLLINKAMALEDAGLITLHKNWFVEA